MIKNEKKKSTGSSTREKMLARKKKLEEKGSGNGLIFPKEGTLRMRIKSPGDDKELGMEVIQFYVPGAGGVISPATFDEPCPFMEEANPEYFIMQKTLENAFIQKGISETKLLNTGIPVSSNFIKNAKSIRREYNISDDENVILIMLGSMGFGEIDNIINPLLKENIKIIVICGTNKQLYEKLNEYKNDNLIVIGFTKNINDFIYSSDYVLSKPGGLSSTEIASIHKPLLHIYPIPGIETYNTLFFENNKMSIKCDTDKEIIDNIKYLMNNEDICKEMIQNQKKIINENSASDLVKFILDHFN